MGLELGVGVRVGVGLGLGFGFGFGLGLGIGLATPNPYQDYEEHIDPIRCALPLSEPPPGTLPRALLAEWRTSLPALLTG